MSWVQRRTMLLRGKMASRSLSLAYFYFLLASLFLILPALSKDVCPIQCNARIDVVDAKSYAMLVASLGLEGCDLTRDVCRSPQCGDVDLECVCDDCSIRLSAIRIRPLSSSPSLSSSRIITDILEFGKLESFALSGTTLTGSIPRVSSPILANLTVSGNIGLKATIDSYEFLPSIQALDFSNNDLYGFLPDLPSLMPNLTYLNMSSNNFSSFTPSLFNASRLNIIDLSYNKLAGPFPSVCTSAAPSISGSLSCFVQGQDVPTASPSLQPPAQSSCETVPIFGGNVATSARSPSGFARAVNLTSDSTDGLVFQLKFSSTEPYYEPDPSAPVSVNQATLSSKLDATNVTDSNFPSRAQIGILSSSVPGMPVLIFDVMAHSDGYVSARVYGNLNHTVGILAHGVVRAQLFQNRSQISAFCSWKRSRTVEVKCGISLESNIIEFSYKDPTFEKALLTVYGFLPGTETRLDYVAPLTVKGTALPVSFLQANDSQGLWANSWTPSRRASAVDTSLRRGLGLRILAASSTPSLSKRPSSSPTLHPAITLSPTTSLPSSSPITSSPSKTPSSAPTPFPEPYLFSYCEAIFSEFAPYRCNPFNCFNSSVRCVDDLFGANTCGDANNIDRCEKSGVALVACPLDDFYTCNNGTCISIAIGASGCDSLGGVRFSPFACVADTPSPTLTGQTVTPHPARTSSPSSSSPISADNQTLSPAAPAMTLVNPLVPVSVVLGMIICIGCGAFICRKRMRRRIAPNIKESRKRKLSQFSSDNRIKSDVDLPHRPNNSQPGASLNAFEEALSRSLPMSNSTSSAERHASSGPGDSAKAVNQSNIKSFKSTSAIAGPVSTFSPLAVVGSVDGSRGRRESIDVIMTKKPGLKRQYDTEPILSQDSDRGDQESGGFGLMINFDDIELGEMMGAGGNGRIFRAAYNGTPVAVKELFSVMRGSPREFSREFEALKLLRHPHIIQLFGTCIAPSADAIGTSRHFIVTELAVESLADRLARKDDPIEMTQVERYATEIASAGAFIHSQNMIHFDIKPQNVLLDVSGTVKICDLGIAKFVQKSNHEENLLSLTSAQGTPAYMSPELLAGDDPARITKKVDVYAFGVLTWEMVHREPPYPSSWSLLTLFRNVDQGFRPAVDENKLPPNTVLRTIVESCWEGEPEKRPNFKDIIAMLTNKRRNANSLNTPGVPFEISPARSEPTSLLPPLSPPRQRGSTRLTSPGIGSRVRLRAASLTPNGLASMPTGFTSPSGTPVPKLQTPHPVGPSNLLQNDSPATLSGTSVGGSVGGVVIGLNEDGSVAVKLEEVAESDSIVNVSNAEIIQVMDPIEDEDFISVDKTIRGLALAHARRRLREFKRMAKEEEAVKVHLAERLTHLDQPCLNDAKLIVVKNEDDERPKGNPMTLGLSLELMKPDGDVKDDPTFTGDLIITEGVALDQNGGITLHENRKTFKSDLETSFDITRHRSSVIEEDDDALVYFPSIAQESVVIISELGCGACGMVYKAIHVPTLQIIAIKRVNVADRLKRHQVVRETRIMLANNLHTRRDVVSPPPLLSSVSAKDVRKSGGLNPRASLSKGSSFSKRFLDVTGGSSFRGSSSSSQKSLGKRAHSTKSPALVLSPTKLDRKQLVSHAASSRMDPNVVQNPNGETEAVARGITQVKVSSFACEKIVKLYDAALFSREMFSDSLRLRVDGGAEKDFALVMEYLDGGSLEDHIKHSGNCGVHEATLAKVATDCLEALHFLEINRIIHRDIKPANIMLSRKGTAKLTDFGVVKELDDDSMGLGKTFVGTMTYMSPERLRGHPYTYVSDIWSLGLTLLAFAIGRYPVDRASANSIFALLEIFEHENILKEFETKFPAEMLDFFRCCLRPNALDRPNAKTLLSHPFIVMYAREDSFLHAEDAFEASVLSKEERILDLHLIARKVVEKLLVDWMNEQSTKTLPRGGLEFTFAEESFERLSKQMSLTMDDVKAAFNAQIQQIKDLI